jgi:hypothetical protein
VAGLVGKLGLKEPAAMAGGWHGIGPWSKASRTNSGQCSSFPLSLRS